MATSGNKLPSARLSNAAWLLAIRVLGIATLIASYKVVAWRFGGDTLGQYVLANVLIQITAQVACFGLPVFLMKTLASGKATGSSPTSQPTLYGQALTTVSINLLLVSILGTLVMALLWFSGCIQTVLGLPFFCLAYVGLAVPLFSFRVLNAQTMRGLGYTKLFQSFDCLIAPALFAAFFVGGLAIAPKTTPPLHLILGAHLLALLICAGLSFAFTNHLGQHPKLGITSGQYAKLLTDSKDFFVIQAITQGFGWSSIILLGMLASPSAAGAMNIILKSVSLLGIVISVVNSYAGPIYSKLFQQRQLNKLSAQIQKNTRLIVVCSLPFIVAMFLFKRHVLIFFDPAYQDLTLAFAIVLAGATINVYFGSIGLLMQMCELEKPFRRIIFIALLLHIIVGSALSTFLGAVGIAIGYSLSLAFWNVMSARRLKSETGLSSYVVWPVA